MGKRTFLGHLSIKISATNGATTGIEKNHVIRIMLKLLSNLFQKVKLTKSLQIVETKNVIRTMSIT